MEEGAILVVDDEEDLLELIGYNLEKAGFRISLAATGEEGLKKARAEGPALVLLDLMLPGLDGLQVCRILKSDPATSRIAVVMLTAKSEEEDVVRGLEAGADDYVAKPFSLEVLLARIRSVLRRLAEAPGGGDGDAPIALDELLIHPGRHEALVRGQPISLTLTEFRILCLMARRPGWVFSRDQIVNSVHGEECEATGRSVDVQMVGLRKKLGPYGKRLETVRGVGYRLKEH